MTNLRQINYYVLNKLLLLLLFQFRLKDHRRRTQQQIKNNYVVGPPSATNRTYNLNGPPAFNMYSQFDVSKLTGKSPTTQCFFQDEQQPNDLNPVKQTASNSATSNTFQWPDKIHVSAVAAQNTNLLWPKI